MDSIPVVRADFTRTCQPTNVMLTRARGRGGGCFNSMWDREREREKNKRIQQIYTGSPLSGVARFCAIGTPGRRRVPPRPRAS